MEEQSIWWKSPDCPPEVMSDFESYVMNYENQPLSTMYYELVKRGYSPKPPEQISEDETEAAVLELAQELFGIRTIVVFSDHLSDRELYAELWEQIHEETKLFPDDLDGLHTLDMCDVDEDAYLRYYADDEYRQSWLRDFPEEPLPPKGLPPYPRSHKLPQDDRRQRRLNSD